MDQHENNVVQLERPQVVNVGGARFGLRGFMRVQLINATTGKCRWDSGFFPNKILTAGRNNMNTVSSWLTHCHVGTNGTAPQATDTQLLGFVVSTSSTVAFSDGTQPSAPYYGWYRQTFRFAVGAGHGGQNISEAGIGWGASGSVLISRALIIDPITQQTTTVTPLADEIMDVTYELRYYPPLSDVYNTVTLNGVVYDTVTRAAEVTNNRWSVNIGDAIGQYSPFVSSWRAYDGALGTITQSPSGNPADHNAGDQYDEGYSNNSYQIVMMSPTGALGWNLGAGIRCIRIQTTAGMYQTSFAAQSGGATIPKTTGFTMVMGWTLSWAGLNWLNNWNMIAASDSTTPVAGEWNTNVAETLLRISWTDDDVEDRQNDLKVSSGTIIRIEDTTDATKFVEYTVSGSYTEQASWTEYSVTQTAIQNSGPTVGNLCLIRNMDV